MKLEHKRRFYKLPPIGMAQEASIMIGDYQYALVLVAEETFFDVISTKEKRDFLGIPTWYTILAFPEGPQLGVFPRPDKDYDLKFRYFPPLQEI